MLLLLCWRKVQRPLFANVVQPKRFGSQWTRSWDVFTATTAPARSVFTVLYAGAHGDANALDNVIAAARFLEQCHVPIRIRFVGDGPQAIFDSACRRSDMCEF